MSSSYLQLSSSFMLAHMTPGTTFRGTPIYSMTDPWLGIGLQLLPFPQALLSIILIAIPTSLIPAVLNHFALLPTQELLRTLISHLRSFSSLWLNSERFITAIHSSEKKLLNEKERTSNVQKLVHHQRPLIFTLKQVCKMHKRWSRYNGRVGMGPLAANWTMFMSGRCREIIDDVSSELTSDAGDRLNIKEQDHPWTPLAMRHGVFSRYPTHPSMIHRQARDLSDHLQTPFKADYDATSSESDDSTVTANTPRPMSPLAGYHPTLTPQQISNQQRLARTQLRPQDQAELLGLLLHLSETRTDSL